MYYRYIYRILEFCVPPFGSPYSLNLILHFSSILLNLIWCNLIPDLLHSLPKVVEGITRSRDVSDVSFDQIPQWFYGIEIRRFWWVGEFIDAKF